MTREELELLIDIRDVTTQSYVILGRKLSELLEKSIESDLGMQFAICNLSLYLKKAGLASRNIVHTKKILLRCVDFCFYFLHAIWSLDFRDFASFKHCF